MKRIVTLMLIFIPAVFLSANMRAPYMRTSMPSRSLTVKTPAPLVVVKEDLSFDCDAPYEGDIGAVAKQRRFAQVTAVYHVDAERQCECAFEFVMPDDVEVAASIGEKPCAAGRAVIAKGEFPDGWSVRINRSLCMVSFSGKLSQGRNVIRIGYRQTVGVSEAHYGYFTKSVFASGFGYELWPLKEWKLSPGFSLNVDVRVADYPGFRRTLFGSKNSVHLYGSGRNADAQSQPCAEAVYSQEDRYLRARVNWTKNFPDVLHVSYGEK